MSIDVTGLERFADVEPVKAKRGGKGTEKTWTIPTLDEFAHGSVLAFDPSLSATGWVHLVSNGSLMVTEAGVYAARSGTEGWEATLRSATELEALHESLLSRYRRSNPGIDIVHEAPPTGGGKFLKPELALLACYGLRRAAADLDITLQPMIAPQRHKRLICGNGNAKKPVEHAALAALAESLPIGGYGCITNEAKRDALCVGLGHLLMKGSNSG